MIAEYTLISSSDGMYAEKGSSFQSISYPVNSILDIKSKLNSLKEQFPDASHISYAYRIKHGQAIDEFAADAGEPKGCAGVPILNVLKSRKLVDAAVFVVRYYGGKKLGVPGLINAYGEAAKKSLSNERIKPWIKFCFLSFTYTYKVQKKVETIIQQYNLKVKEHQYSDSIEMIIEAKESMQKEIIAKLTEITKGNIKINITK